MKVNGKELELELEVAIRNAILQKIELLENNKKYGCCYDEETLNLLNGFIDDITPSYDDLDINFDL